jgi:hypothetical protein
MEIMSTLKDTWWQYAAAAIAIVLAVVVAVNLSEPATGPWWKHFFGTIALGGAPLVLFWWPPFVGASAPGWRTTLDRRSFTCARSNRTLPIESCHPHPCLVRL